MYFVPGIIVLHTVHEGGKEIYTPRRSILRDNQTLTALSDGEIDMGGGGVTLLEEYTLCCVPRSWVGSEYE